MSRLLLACAMLALPLAACNRSEGTPVAINASDEDGNVVAGVSESGEVQLNVPGFSGKFKMPKIHLDADDFDMNGVHLFPGSKITTMNVDANGDDNGRVRVGFESPADANGVRDWFQGKLTAAGFTLKTQGDALVGTTDENKPFRLEMTPDGDRKSRGMLTIDG